MPPVSRIAGPIATVVALGLAVAFGWYRLIVQPTARATEFSESVQEAVRSHDLDLADRQVAEWLDDPNAPRPETGFFLKARIAVLRDRPAEAVDPLRRSLELGHDP